MIRFVFDLAYFGRPACLPACLPSPARSLAQSLTHSLNHSLNDSLTQSLTGSYGCRPQFINRSGSRDVDTPAFEWKVKVTVLNLSVRGEPSG